MSRQDIIMVILLILNLIAVILYIIKYRSREKRHSFVIKAVIMFLCPVVGVLFFALSTLIQKRFFDEPVDLEDVVFSKEKLQGWVGENYPEFADKVTITPAC